MCVSFCFLECHAGDWEWGRRGEAAEVSGPHLELDVPLGCGCFHASQLPDFIWISFQLRSSDAVVPFQSVLHLSQSQIVEVLDEVDRMGETFWESSPVVLLELGQDVCFEPSHS